jgi:hypothetical protein
MICSDSRCWWLLAGAIAFLMISSLATLSWQSLRPRRSIRLELLALFGLVFAALLSEPWLTLAGICIVIWLWCLWGWCPTRGSSGSAHCGSRTTKRPWLDATAQRCGSAYHAELGAIDHCRRRIGRGGEGDRADRADRVRGGHLFAKLGEQLLELLPASSDRAPGQQGRTDGAPSIRSADIVITEPSTWRRWLASRADQSCCTRMLLPQNTVANAFHLFIACG